jgi:hypothetical protein
MAFESDVQREEARKSDVAKAPSRDRKLGDEWTDWNGAIEADLDEPKWRFIVLTSVVWVLFALCIAFAAYMVAPRLQQWPPFLQWSVKGALVVFFLGGLFVYVLILLEVLTERISVLPYRWSERMLFWLLPKAVWVGRKAGLSGDRVGNSFVKVNNALTRSYAKQIDRSRLIVLLPRCLSKETRQGIKNIVSGHSYGIFTVGGGEEARKVIYEQRPSFIIALACERDLVSGIKDVALNVPVFGIANKRPEGPCKNTYVDLEEFESALRFFQETSHEGLLRIDQKTT